jgi:hypothetical protein
MTTENATETQPETPAADVPSEVYRLTVEMPEKYRKILKTAAQQAFLLKKIDEPSVHNVMNLFINLGLQYLVDEGRRAQGYR